MPTEQIKEDKYGLYVEGYGYSGISIFRPKNNTQFVKNDILSSGYLTTTKSRKIPCMGLGKEARGKYKEYWNLLKYAPIVPKKSANLIGVDYCKLINCGMTGPINGIPYYRLPAKITTVREELDKRKLSYGYVDITKKFVRHNGDGYPAYIRPNGDIFFFVHGYQMTTTEEYLTAIDSQNTTTLFLKIKYPIMLPTNISHYDNITEEDLRYIKKK